MSNKEVPVVTIDGPSGSGKGTVASMLAKACGWHLLDSGALYRLTGLAAHNHGVDFGDEPALAVLAEHLDVRFLPSDDGLSIVLEGEEVGVHLRTEQVGAMASRVAVLPGVRRALLKRQQDFAQLPGLVADGRDMGTVVFADAAVKIYLTANAEERARRRQIQLQQKGIDGSFDQLLSDIIARDRRDMNRDVAPLRPADDAVHFDSTSLSIQDVFDCVMDVLRNNGLI